MVDRVQNVLELEGDGAEAPKIGQEKENLLG
jgi:hypothetical protein